MKEKTNMPPQTDEDPLLLLTDNELRELVIAGNDDAFSAIHKRYYGHFHGFLYSMTRHRPARKYLLHEDL